MLRSRLLALFASLALTAPWAAAQRTYHEVWLTSSYDGAVTRSVIMEPDGYDGTPRPLLVLLHGMGGNAEAILGGFDVAADARGWLAAAPDTHGENDPRGTISLAARAAQRDVLDLMDHVSTNWSVDPDRVYLSGASMGGMATTITAAKYADRFAAAVEWFGPADLFDSWNELPWGSFRANMVAEIGGNPSQEPWEYTRRSPIHYARNLRHLPFAIGQGQLDPVVFPHHSRDLQAAIRSFRPTSYGGIYWNWGAHFLWPGDYEKTLRYLEIHTRSGDPPDVLLATDEDQGLWWVGVTGADADAFRTVHAIPFSGNRLWLETRNASSARADLSRTSLDVRATLSVRFDHDVDSEFVLTGLDPARSYSVTRAGQPWPGAVWDPGTATLTVTVALAQAGTEPFEIRS